MVVVKRKPDLLEVVLAFRPCGGLAYLLHRGQEQPNEDGDDGNYNQQFDQREARAAPGMRGRHAMDLAATTGRVRQRHMTTLTACGRAGTWILQRCLRRVARHRTA